MIKIRRNLMIKIYKKIIASIMLLILILTSSSNLVLALTEMSYAQIVNGGDCGRHLQYWKEAINDWSYIVSAFAYYEKDGKQYPAYCLDKEVPGVGSEVAGDTYGVNVNELMKDERLWRVAINGYPYKSPGEMGVYNKYDAFVATKQSVYCIIYGTDPESYYNGADDRGEAIKEAIINLVNIGRNGTQTQSNTRITANKIGNFAEDGEFYTQEYSINSPVEVSQYMIYFASEMPKGTIITDVENNMQGTFKGNQHFKVRIPKTEIKQDINITIGIKSKSKIYPVFYGKTTIPGTQDYMLTYESYGDVEGDIKLNVKTNTGKIQINKTDDETKDPIEGVTFELKKHDGTTVATAITNSKGEAIFKELYPENYILQEISTNKKYVLNKKEFDVKVEYNETTDLEITNEHKKGDLKVYKVDKDNNKITLGNVEFDLYSVEFNKIIGTYKTNVDGEININDLRIGDYKLIEKNTGKWYNLAGDTQIKVEWNRVNQQIIENELQKGQIKVIKVDKDNNEIKIEGVKFEVLDENENILETIVTNENGEAFTSRYAIRDYNKIKLREIETNENYALNGSVETVVIEANNIKEVIIENEVKKGQIKVIKIDRDDHEIKLEGVKFEVKNEQGETVDELITDENGEAVTKYLPISSKYTVTEIETKKEYDLTDKAETVELKQDEIKNIVFENEKKKGQIEVIKVDEENKEYKIKGVIFEVINYNNEIVELIITDEEGKAITSRLPIGEYKLKEIKTDDLHNLNDEIIIVDVLDKFATKIKVGNTRIKGQIEITKTSEDDNFINGEKAGTPIPDVQFEVYDWNNKKVDVITTDKYGKAITKKLDKGRYTLKEVKSGKWYILNSEEQFVDIVKNGEIVQVNITNISEKPGVKVEKDGINKAKANEEIKYDFSIKNTGNVPLDDFTWYDYLPTGYVKATKFATGTYNQKINYSLYYKTNKNDYCLLKDNIDSLKNYYIDLNEVELEEGEFITEIKAFFDKVDIGFSEVLKPELYVKVKPNVQKDDEFLNETKLEGYNKSYLVYDTDNHITKIYEEKIEKKLPKTGF